MKRALRYIELSLAIMLMALPGLGTVNSPDQGKQPISMIRHLMKMAIEVVVITTGIKKDGSNRHVFDRGSIQVEDSAIDEYESITGIKVQNNKNFGVVAVKPTNKDRFSQMLNEKL